MPQRGAGSLPWLPRHAGAAQAPEPHHSSISEPQWASFLGSYEEERVHARFSTASCTPSKRSITPRGTRQRASESSIQICAGSLRSLSVVACLTW
jgi:hypothetical protein